MKYQGRVYFIYLVGLAICISLFPAQIYGIDSEDAVSLSLHDFDNTYNSAFLTDRWKFRGGDDPGYADPDYNDHDWITISTMIPAAEIELINWEGAGWFRLNLDVDSTLVGVPLMLDELNRNGVTEAWLNGKRINSWKDYNHIFNIRLHPDPILIFHEAGHHLLAVRYQNSQVGADANPGFRYDLVKAEPFLTSKIGKLHYNSSVQNFLSGILLIFGLVHLLMFFYYRKHHSNLFFALFCILLGTYLYFYYQLEIAGLLRDVDYGIYLMSLRSLAMLGFIGFVYAVFRADSFPVWRFAGYASVLFLDILLFYTMPDSGMYLLTDLIVLVFLIELTYLLFTGWKQKMEGVAVFGLGFAGFLIAQILVIMKTYDVINLSGGWLDIAGTGILLGAMSVTLSRRFAQTRIDLEAKLEEVKKLSHQKLEQERRQRQSEVRRKLLEADNERKTKELEEARELQLNMLPSQIPGTSYFNIKAGMITASEVGGDYYDFAHTKNDTLVIALGDATGHGARAGTLVTAAKSAFHTGVKQYRNAGLLKEMSGAIKSLNMKGIYMGMSLAECNGNSVTVSQAGMPPVIHYDHSKQQAAPIVCKGMPLGSVENYPYKQVKLEMDSGDILVLLSDGLPETINRFDLMDGYARMYETIEQNADQSLEIIYEKLINLVKKHSENGAPPDDATLVLLQR